VTLAVPLAVTVQGSAALAKTIGPATEDSR
jgi:hypothetical protein